ncbi:hypothetical protein M3A76_04945 [Corynebacterium sanguinis]|uniref:hypothetical protein n=1 Tax=Corynebacterium sanguinis TaxID=2594913 RepID=UPI0021A80080|nr:hypothetical protein [Corynebacterium sanguinis]MCT1882392.1 hypothetical protein [Corynebacterium sanguinis]
MAEANPGIEAVVFDDAGHLFSEDIEKAIGRSWEYMMGGTIEGKVGEARIGRDLLRPARALARLDLPPNLGEMGCLGHVLR